MFGRQWVGVGMRRRRRRARLVPRRRRPGGSRCWSSATRPARCARSSTCAGTGALRWPAGAVTPACLSCPYHAWLYRLDGSLARAGGVGQPDGFDAADFGLREIQVATFARSIMVNVDPCGGAVRSRAARRRASTRTASTSSSSASAPATSATSTGRCCSRTTARTTTRRSSTRSCRSAGYEYPIECAGNVVFAWDRPLEPRDRSEQALHDHRPGTPGWAAVADVAADESFNNGSYLALFPNTAVSCFAGFAATFRLTPDRPVDHRRRARVPLAPVGARRAPGRRSRRHPRGRRAGPRHLRGAAGHVRRRARPPTGCSRPSTSPVSPTSTSCCSAPSPPGAEPPSVRSPAMPGSTRTRISVEQRRQQILDATHRVTLRARACTTSASPTSPPSSASAPG